LKGLRSTAEQAIGQNVSPVLKWVAELSRLEGKDFYVASQVATELGISVQAVRKYAKNRVCGEGKVPSYRARFSKKTGPNGEDDGIQINLYTKEDIETLREFLNGRQVVYKT